MPPAGRQCRHRYADSLTVQMSFAEYDTFVAWVKTTLNNGTARFTANVWLGTSYVNKACMFIKPGTMLTGAYISVDKVAVPMTLRVFDA